MNKRTHLCAPCRVVDKYLYTCPRCGGSMLDMGTRWRAPKKSNKRAWARVDKGDYWWDDRALAKRAPIWHHQNLGDLKHGKSLLGDLRKMNLKLKRRLFREERLGE